jgi:hypothetical protein
LLAESFKSEVRHRLAQPVTVRRRGRVKGRRLSVQFHACHQANEQQLRHTIAFQPHGLFAAVRPVISATPVANNNTAGATNRPDD